MRRVLRRRRRPPFFVAFLVAFFAFVIYFESPVWLKDSQVYRGAVGAKVRSSGICEDDENFGSIATGA